MAFARSENGFLGVLLQDTPPKGSKTGGEGGYPPIRGVVQKGPKKGPKSV